MEKKEVYQTKVLKWIDNYHFDDLIYYYYYYYCIKYFFCLFYIFFILFMYKWRFFLFIFYILINTILILTLKRIGTKINFLIK